MTVAVSAVSLKKLSSFKDIVPSNETSEATVKPSNKLNVGIKLIDSPNVVIKSCGLKIEHFVTGSTELMVRTRGRSRAFTDLDKFQKEIDKRNCKEVRRKRSGSLDIQTLLSDIAENRELSTEPCVSEVEPYYEDSLDSNNNGIIFQVKRYEQNKNEIKNENSDSSNGLRVNQDNIKKWLQEHGIHSKLRSFSSANFRSIDDGSPTLKVLRSKSHGVCSDILLLRNNLRQAKENIETSAECVFTKEKQFDNTLSVERTTRPASDGDNPRLGDVNFNPVVRKKVQVLASVQVKDVNTEKENKNNGNTPKVLVEITTDSPSKEKHDKVVCARSLRKLVQIRCVLVSRLHCFVILFLAHESVATRHRDSQRTVNSSRTTSESLVTYVRNCC